MVNTGQFTDKYKGDEIESYTIQYDIIR